MWEPSRCTPDEQSSLFCLLMEQPSGAFVQWTFVDANSVLVDERKRARAASAYLACESCRTKHKKCDGAQPRCGRCDRTRGKCVYAAKRRKNNPAALRKSSGSSSQIIVTAAPVNIEHGDTSLLLENHLVNSFNFSSYIQLYNDHVDQIIFQGSAGVPEQEYNAFQNIHDSRRLLFMNGVLATGAYITGNHKVSNEYYMTAYNLMKDLYKDMSALVAATHTLFTHRLAMMGEIEKAARANTLATKILEYLIRSRPDEMDQEGVQLATHYLKCLVRQIDICPTASPETVNQMLRNVSRLNEQLPVPEDARGSIRAFCQAALLRNDGLDCPSEHLPHLIAMLAKSREQMPEICRVQPSIANRMDMAQDRCLAVMHLSAGNIIEAVQAADNLMSFARRLGTDYNDVYMVTSLFCAGQVYIRMGFSERYQELLEKLHSIAKDVPLALRTAARLEQINQQVHKPGAHPLDVAYIPVQTGWSWELVELPIAPPGIDLSEPSMAHPPLAVWSPTSSESFDILDDAPLSSYKQENNVLLSPLTGSDSSSTSSPTS